MEKHLHIHLIKDHRENTPPPPRLTPEQDMRMIAAAILGPQFSDQPGPARWGVVRDGIGLEGLAVQDDQGNYFVYDTASVPRKDGETRGLRRVKYDANGRKTLATQILRDAEEEFKLPYIVPGTATIVRRGFDLLRRRQQH